MVGSKKEEEEAARDKECEIRQSGECVLEAAEVTCVRAANESR